MTGVSGAPDPSRRSRLCQKTEAPTAAGGSAARARDESRATEGGQDALLGKFPGDAPLCENCGHITIRNGTCYKCLNCGTSMGCS